MIIDTHFFKIKKKKRDKKYIIDMSIVSTADWKVKKLEKERKKKDLLFSLSGKNDNEVALLLKRSL